MSEFQDKVVLITGGRSGIGAACAGAFADAGAEVVTAQRGRDDKFDWVAADFLDPKAPRRVVDSVIESHGRLDVLVNNAGVMREGSVLEASESDWAETLQVNLTAPFLLMKFAIPHLIDSQGAIVNIGSIEGLGANPGHPAYCASKAGLHGLTRAVAVDHGGAGVRCNAVAPGWIDTELNLDFLAGLGEPEAVRARLAELHPAARTGTPEDVAALVVWLASRQAGFVTGQVWTVDGGRMTKLSLP